MLQRILCRRFASRGTLELTQAVKETDLAIVDVTSLEEWDQAVRDKSIPQGAIHIPISDLASRAKELGGDKTRPVIFYCKHGVRAGLAATFAQRNGFFNAFAATDASAVKAILEAFSSK